MRTHLLGTFRHPEGQVSSVLFINGNQHLVTGGFADGSARIWDIPSGTEGEVLLRHEHSVLCMAASADCHWLATGGYDGMKAFDLKTWKEIPSWGPKQTVGSVAFDPHSQRLAVYYWELVQISDMASREVCCDCLRTKGVGSLQVCFTPDGTELILTDYYYTMKNPDGSGAGSNLIQRVTIGSGQVRARFRSPAGIRRFSVSRCGTLVAATGYDGKTHVWDVSSGREIRTIPACGWAIAFHPHRKALAIGEEDAVTLWPLDGTSPLAVLKGATLWSWTDELTFSPDGSLLAATGETAALWAVDLPLVPSLDTFASNTCPTLPPGL